MLSSPPTLQVGHRCSPRPSKWRRQRRRGYENVHKWPDHADRQWKDQQVNGWRIEFPESCSTSFGNAVPLYFILGYPVIQGSFLYRRKRKKLRSWIHNWLLGALNCHHKTTRGLRITCATGKTAHKAPNESVYQRGSNPVSTVPFPGRTHFLLTVKFHYPSKFTSQKKRKESSNRHVQSLYSRHCICIHLNVCTCMCASKCLGSSGCI